MRKYKTTGNTTLFDKEDKERKLSEMGDPLERLSQVIDFEMFRSELEEALLPKERKSNAGAKRYDVVMMFKRRTRCWRIRTRDSRCSVTARMWARRIRWRSTG